MTSAVTDSGVGAHPASIRRHRMRGYAAAAGALVVLAGAALYAVTPHVNTQEERTAQALVVDLTQRTAMASYRQNIDEFARAAAGPASGLTLIGIDHDGAFGHLTFQVTLDAAAYTQNTGDWFAPSPESWDPGPYCFRVTLSEHGKVGRFGTADGVGLVECPDGATAITPTLSRDPVVPPEARDAAHDVLAELAPADRPEADDIAAKVNALLPASYKGRPVAQASAMTDGADVGLAMGRPDDCVLVARINGDVVDVYPPAVYLQPGELGCSASTAIADDLRPPH